MGAGSVALSSPARWYNPGYVPTLSMPDSGMLPHVVRNVASRHFNPGGVQPTAIGSRRRRRCSRSSSRTRAVLRAKVSFEPRSLQALRVR